MVYSFVFADKSKFSIYYAIYYKTNIADSFDWNELLESASGDKYIFVMNGERIVGGFVLSDNIINYLFILPLVDEKVFWEQLISYALAYCSHHDIVLNYVSESDMTALLCISNITLIQSSRRMARPTEKTVHNLVTKYYFAIPDEGEIDEIVKIVYESHLNGFTATVKNPDRTDIYNEIDIYNDIDRRFKLFYSTNTLHFSTLVKRKGSNEIIGVCMAGIYPDSPNQFSTIHQVSVHPSFRRQGIAAAMMLHTIEKASDLSPVITLGVMIGNPAELLYEKIGFRKGASFSTLRIEV